MELNIFAHVSTLPSIPLFKFHNGVQKKMADWEVELLTNVVPCIQKLLSHL
jgi:hypothetical protein